MLGELLQKYAAANIPVTEGSISLDQMNFFYDFLNNKGREVRTILEIGFNGGLSSALFLAANKNINVVSIDIGAHDYVLKAKQWIDQTFPHRHTLIVGNSLDVLIQMELTFNSYKPDMVFVDGGHTDNIPYLDLYNLHRIIKGRTWVFVDDVCPAEPAVVEAVRKIVKEEKYAVLGQNVTKDRGWVLLKKLE